MESIADAGVECDCDDDAGRPPVDDAGVEVAPDDLLTREDGSFFILFPGKTCSSYSGGEGLFPFPFPIHLVSIFLQRYCCE